MAHEAGEERERFQSEVESWFEAEAPRKGTTGDFSAIHIVSAESVEEYRRAERLALDKSLQWQRKLYAAGLSGRSWPEPYGGQGAPAWQDEVVAEVQSRYGVSTKVLSVGLEMLPPVLVQHGSAEQCLRYLPPVLSGTETWCQLLSEPDAGSDLGSATTLAAPAPGGWTVSGQKVWTSGAGTSDFALLDRRGPTERRRVWPGSPASSSTCQNPESTFVLSVRCPAPTTSTRCSSTDVFVPQDVPDRQGSATRARSSARCSPARGRPSAAAPAPARLSS